MGTEAKCFVIGVVILILAGLLYFILSHKRWIRVRAMVSLVTLLAAAPAISIVVKAYGIDVSVGESSLLRDFMVPAIVGIAVICLFVLELNFQQHESHHKFIHEFQSVVIDSLQHRIPTATIARNHGLPIEKVQAILVCVGLIGVWTRDNPDNP